MATDTTQRRRKALHRRATGAIRRRYAELDLSLDDVAGELGCSTRQLQRVFREVGEDDFRSTLLAVRMNRARELLTRPQTPLPVRVIAPRVGYRQASGLRQAFKRYFGINPSEIQLPPPDYDVYWRAAERGE